MKNPWLSVWLSAANTWAGAARGFWTAEMHRQQGAVAREMTQAFSSPRSRRPATKKRSAAKRRNKAGG
jgi:hypothetical protein